MTEATALARPRQQSEQSQNRRRETTRLWKLANKERLAALDHAWYLANKEKVAKKSKAFYERNKLQYCKRSSVRRLENLERALVIGAKSRAKSKGVVFDIDASDVFIPPTCPILGLELSVGRGKQLPCSPSLDRIDPTKGYVRGNVQVISYLANTMKSNATPEQLVAFGQWALQQYAGRAE